MASCKLVLAVVVLVIQMFGLCSESRGSDECGSQAGLIESAISEAQKAFDRYSSRLYGGGGGSIGLVHLWSTRLFRTELLKDPTPNNRARVCDSYSARTNRLLEYVKGQPNLDPDTRAFAAYAVADSKVQILTVGKSEESKVPNAQRQRVDAARQFYQEIAASPYDSRARLVIYLEEVALASQHLMESEMSIWKEANGRAAAAEAYLERTKKLSAIAEGGVKEGKLGLIEVTLMTYYSLDAQATQWHLKDETKEYLNAKRKQIEAAQTVYQSLWKAFLAGRGDPEHLYRWSKSWLDAELASVTRNADKGSAREAHQGRMEQLWECVKAQVEQGRASIGDLYRSQWFVLEAKLAIASEPTK